MGVEPTTFYLQGKCSTTKLYRRAVFLSCKPYLMVTLSIKQIKKSKKLPVGAAIQLVKINAITIANVAKVCEAPINVSNISKHIFIFLFPISIILQFIICNLIIFTRCILFLFLFYFLSEFLFVSIKFIL